jgi:predicted lipid-binding transport protein (Tim44 family)
MAKTKTHSRAMVLRPAMSRPTIIKMPAPIVKVKKTKHRRHHGGGGGHMLGGLMNKQRLGIMAGAFAVGFLQKQALLQKLPALPLIGATGTLGLAAYLFSNGGKNRLADEVCTAAFVLAANELATTGTVVGAEEPNPADVGYVAGW